MDNQVTVEELLEMVNKGQRLFSRICVEDGVLTEFNFSNLSFEECLFSVNFTDANFENTRFINSNLKTCNFSNCNLSNAVFDGNLLDGTEFLGASINEVTFINNTFHSMVLTEAHLAKMIGY